DSGPPRGRPPLSGRARRSLRETSLPLRLPDEPSAVRLPSDPPASHWSSRPATVCPPAPPRRRIPSRARTGPRQAGRKSRKRQPSPPLHTSLGVAAGDHPPSEVAFRRLEAHLVGNLRIVWRHGAREDERLDARVLRDPARHLRPRSGKNAL